MAWLSVERLKTSSTYARFQDHADAWHEDKPRAHDHGHRGHGYGRDRDGGGRGRGRDHGDDAYAAPLGGKRLCRTYRTACNRPHSIRAQTHLGPQHDGDGFLEQRQLRPQSPALGCGICTAHM